MNIPHYGFGSRSFYIFWLGQAFQAGMLNAGGFISCHRFVSHITGFGTQMGINFARGEWLFASEMLLIPIGFILGAMTSAKLIDARQMDGKKARPDIVILLITLCILLVVIFGELGWLGVFGEPMIHQRDYFLMALLCYICGMQNAAVSSLTKNAMRATHLTGIATDFGINFIKINHLAKNDPHRKLEKKWNRIRFFNMLLFSAGSFFAVFVFTDFQFLGFIAPLLNSLIFLYLYYRAQNKLKKSETDYLKEFTHV